MEWSSRFFDPVEQFEPGIRRQPREGKQIDVPFLDQVIMAAVAMTIENRIDFRTDPGLSTHPSQEKHPSP